MINRIFLFLFISMLSFSSWAARVDLVLLEKELESITQFQKSEQSIVRLMNQSDFGLMLGMSLKSFGELNKKLLFRLEGNVLKLQIEGFNELQVRYLQKNLIEISNSKDSVKVRDDKRVTLIKSIVNLLSKSKKTKFSSSLSCFSFPFFCHSHAFTPTPPSLSEVAKYFAAIILSPIVYVATIPQRGEEARLRQCSQIMQKPLVSKLISLCESWFENQMDEKARRVSFKSLSGFVESISVPENCKDIRSAVAKYIVDSSEENGWVILREKKSCISRASLNDTDLKFGTHIKDHVKQ